MQGQKDLPAEETPAPGEGPPAREFIRVGVSATTLAGSPEEAREHFRLFNAIHIRNLLEPALLAAVLRLCERSAFVAEEDTPGFREVEASPQAAGRVLNLALDRAPLMRWLEEVSGCGPLATIAGRVSQTLLRPGDELLWHDDIQEFEGRRLAMVIHLGTAPYTGGEFLMRPKGEEVLFEHRYTELNSAMIFRVEPHLEHRVAPLRSGGPRRVFAGWAFDRSGGGGSGR